jgi:hypothetical protein
MKGLFVFVLLLVLIGGCRHADGIPSNIMSKDKMENILWDLILADQFSTQFLIKDSSRINVKLETIKLYSEVFKIHDVTKDEFQRSYQYYLTRPDLTKKMLDTLSERARRQRLVGPQKPMPSKPK